MMTIRELIVRELEAACERAERPIHWRLDAQGRAERGTENGPYTLWETVHPLSPYLLTEVRKKAQHDPDIPY